MKRGAGGGGRAGFRGTVEREKRGREEKITRRKKKGGIQML